MKFITKENLITWLIDRIDMDISCYEDLELREGIRNDFHRGKVAAFEELLIELDK